MAPKKNTVGAVPAVHAAVASHPQPTNGVVTSNGSPVAAVVNRKKAKRRAKEAARKVGPQEKGEDDEHSAETVEPSRETDQLPHRDGDTPLAYDPNYYYESGDAEADQNGDYAYSDDDQYPYDPAAPVHANHSQNRIPNRARMRRKRDATHGQNIPANAHYRPHAPAAYPAPRPISDDALRTVQRGINSGTWNMSSADERRQIKEYWLSLRENERKALVKIEKNDVLQKMKDQQKHSCSCTVCGRKRVAIEEELEILYDAYYKELEQYANHNQHLVENGAAMMPPPIRPTSRSPPPPRSPPRRAPRGRVEEVLEGEDEGIIEDEEDLEEEDYSDEDYDDDYSEDERLPPAATEFFTFGNSLTVKGGILTVADDLLKNDGQKFIDMMEQLAERRMQREEQALNATLPSHAPMSSQHSHADHNHMPPEDDEYDEEDDEEYDSQDEEYDEEDDVDTMTESQRMEEGRRMFQIFAARMFEQRVLDAYRKKRSEDRARLLIEELEAEAVAQSQNGAKSAKKNEKKRAKEKAKKQALKEEKDRKDAERLAAIAEEERRKQEEQRRKQEESKRKQEAKAEEKRQKLEAARKAQEEEKARKRAEEQERKVKEQKLKDEKRQREEAERKEKEEQDRKLRLEQEAQADTERRSKEKFEQEAASKRQTEPTKIPENLRKAPVPAVALPPTLKSRTSTAGFDSPQVKIATPVLPVVPTPARGREFPSRTSQTSTPQTPESMFQSKQPTPPTRTPAQPPSQNAHVGTSRTPAQHAMFTPQMSPMHNIAPPPGMSTPMSGPHMNMQHISPNGFPGMPSPFTHGFTRSPIGPQMPGYLPHISQLGSQHRSFMPQAANGPPPGITPIPAQANNRHFMGEPTSSPAAHLKTSPLGHGSASGRENNVQHGRQPSLSGLTSLAPAMESSLTQPIGRPAPIGRPGHDLSIGRARNQGSDIDELGARLGSSALLDDNDDHLPTPAQENRRVSAPFAIPSLATHTSSGSTFDQNQSPFGQSLPTDGWRSIGPAFGPPGLATAAPGWGQPPGPGAGWGNPASFPAVPHRHGSMPRPVGVRLLAVQAYRSLSSQSPGVDGGYFDFSDLARHAAESARRNHEALPTPDELQNILDTEGDNHNGGGFFATKQDKAGRRLLVKWLSDSDDHGHTVRPGMGLGEIGSPLPGSTMPFGSLGSRAF